MRIESFVANFDLAFPSLVRFCGLVALLILIGFCLAGHAVHAAPGFIPAGSMILYKVVHDAARQKKDEENSDDSVYEDAGGYYREPKE